MLRKIKFKAMPFFALLPVLLVASNLKAQNSKNGNSLLLKGNNYVEMYNFNSLLSLQSGSISFWFKIADNNTDNYLFSMSNKNAVGSTNNEFYIKYREGFNSIQSVVIIDGVIKMDAYLPTNSITDQNWHNYTLVSDNAGSIKIYLDGVESTLTTGACCGGTTDDYFFGDITGINNMKIGALERTSFYYSNEFSIDDFRIWDKALTSTEVSSTISSVSNPPVDNLVLYYNFEEIENLSVGIPGTNDTRDRTGNTQHGDIVQHFVTAIKKTSNIYESIPIILYPNPVKKQFKLDFEISGSDQIELTIIDQTGKTNMKWVESIENNYNKEIDVTQLTPGCYTILVNGRKINQVIKFVKE